jgi:hypothetical protein
MRRPTTGVQVTSVSDPDSIRSVDPYPDLDSGFGIRIRIQEGEMTHKRRKKLRSFMFEVLDVLF